MANGYHTGSADSDRPITPDGSIGQPWSEGYTEICPSFVCAQSSSQRRCYCQSPLCPCRDCSLYLNKRVWKQTSVTKTNERRPQTLFCTMLSSLNRLWSSPYKCTNSPLFFECPHSNPLSAGQPPPLKPYNHTSAPVSPWWRPALFPPKHFPPIPRLHILSLFSDSSPHLLANKTWLFREEAALPTSDMEAVSPLWRTFSKPVFLCVNSKPVSLAFSLSSPSYP